MGLHCIAMRNRSLLFCFKFQELLTSSVVELAQDFPLVLNNKAHAGQKKSQRSSVERPT